MIKSKLHSNKLLNIILLFFFFSSLGFSNTFKGTSLLMNKESIKKDNKHQQQSFKKEEGEAISCDFEACINNNCG